MNALILAAGRGERLRPITDELPKALVEVAGKPLIEHHLKRLAVAGAKQVVINLDWLGEQIIARVGDGSRYGLRVVYSPEYGNVLETAGGINRALPMLGAKPFWVINADIFTDYQLPNAQLPADATAHLVMVPTPEFKGHGDFDLEDGFVTNSESPALTFSGIARYRPDFFAALAHGYAALAPLLRAAADRRELCGERYTGTWEDVGTPERLSRVLAENPS